MSNLKIVNNRNIVIDISKSNPNRDKVFKLTLSYESAMELTRAISVLVMYGYDSLMEGVNKEDIKELSKSLKQLWGFRVITTVVSVDLIISERLARDIREILKFQEGSLDTAKAATIRTISLLRLS